jgi:hypothetical protein
MDGAKEHKLKDIQTIMDPLQALLDTPRQIFEY